MIPCSQVCEIPHFCEKKNCTLDTTRTGSGNSKNSIYKDNTFRRITPLLRRTQKHFRQLRLPLDNQLEDVMNAEKKLTRSVLRTDRHQSPSRSSWPRKEASEKESQTRACPSAHERKRDPQTEINLQRRQLQLVSTLFYNQRWHQSKQGKTFARRQHRRGRVPI